MEGLAGGLRPTSPPFAQTADVPAAQASVERRSLPIQRRDKHRALLRFISSRRKAKSVRFRPLLPLSTHRYPSGQRSSTVNRAAMPSQVQIHALCTIIADLVYWLGLGAPPLLRTTPGKLIW